tara:strand:+ start:1361 stop:1780 length:420 start_codon:yes stop_codon:yes gene_type:complete
MDNSKDNSKDNSIVSVLNKEDAIIKGDEILSGNDFFRDLSELMENDKFNLFFKKYMNDWIGIKCTVTYMRLYKELKEKHKDIHNDVLDKNIIVFLLTRIMRNKHLRPVSIETIDEILQDDKLDFFEELERKLSSYELKN